MIEEELSARLAAHAPLAALIGPAIYPGDAPPNTPAPFVIYTRQSTSPDDTLTPGEGLPEAVFQLDVYAREYAGAKAIAREVRAALDGWSGEPPDAIFCAHYSGEWDEMDRDSRVVRVSLEFAVKYRA